MINTNQIQNSDLFRLWQQYQQSKSVQIREKLVHHYLPLVKLVAGKIAIGMPQHVDKDDLISNGFFGLLEAIDRFDPERGIKFETYAVVRIRGAILDAIRVQDWVPSTLRQKARQYEKAISEIENQLGRSATEQEVADKLGLNVSDLHQLLNKLNASTIIPLEEFAKTETSANVNFSPSENIEEQEVKDTLAGAIDRLPEKEKTVVSLYYYEDLTLKEISVVMKLSEARISQLHTKAVFRLRGALARIKSSLI